MKYLLLLLLTIPTFAVSTAYQDTTIKSKVIDGYEYSVPEYAFIRIYVGDAKQIEVRRGFCRCISLSWWTTHLKPELGYVIIPVSLEGSVSQWVSVHRDYDPIPILDWTLIEDLPQYSPRRRAVRSNE